MASVPCLCLLENVQEDYESHILVESIIAEIKNNSDNNGIN